MALRIDRPTDAVVDAISQPLKVGDVVAFTNNYYSMATLALVTKIGNADNVQLDGGSYVQRTSVIVVNDNLTNIGADYIRQTLLNTYGDKMTEAPVQEKKEAVRYLVVIPDVEVYGRPSFVQIVAVTGATHFTALYNKVREEVGVAFIDTKYVRKDTKKYFRATNTPEQEFVIANYAKESLMSAKRLKELGIDPSIHTRLSLEEFERLIPEVESTARFLKALRRSISTTPPGSLRM